MKKRAMLLCLCVPLLLTTGCGEKKAERIALCNQFVTAMNNGDYTEAKTLTNIDDKMFMTLESFEESFDMQYTLPANFVAEKVKYNKDTSKYVFSAGNGSCEFKLCESTTPQLVNLEDLLTTVDVFVPSDATVTYNGIAVTEEYMSDDDGVTKTYTLTEVPISPCLLEYSTTYFGSDARLIDPSIGDEYESELPEECYPEIVACLTTTLNSWYAGFQAAQSYTDLSFVPDLDRDTLTGLLEKVKENRKLDEPYTSFHDATVELREDYIISVDFVTSTVVEVAMPVDVNWGIGESKRGHMTFPYEVFTMERVDSGWALKGLSDWELITNLQAAEVQ